MLNIKYDIVGSFLRPQEMKEARAKFNNNEIDYIYHEVSNDGYKAHMDIDVLASALKKNRDRVYCMHLGDSMDLEKIKKYGFRSVR